MLRFLSVLLIMLTAMPMVARAADNADLAKRIELSKKLHQVMPVSVREQVNIAIDEFVKQQPEDQREVFRANMRNALNYEALEKISVDAMAETYTDKELQVQIDYYSKPEAKSINDKYEAYANKVFPQISKMLDKAMMQARTGNSGQ